MLKLLERIKRTPKDTEPKIAEISEDIGASEKFEDRFRQRLKATTPEVVSSIATAERSASRSAKQRRSGRPPAVRTVQWSARVDPEALAVLELLAESRGRRTASDGLHALVADLIEDRKFTKKAIAERVAKRVAQKAMREPRKKKGAGE